MLDSTRQYRGRSRSQVFVVWENELDKLSTGRQQANELLNAPAPSTLEAKRDRAILPLLISCGLRRAELVRPDLVGKGNRLHPDVPTESAVRETLNERLRPI